MLWVETPEVSQPTTQHRLTSNTNRLAHSGEDTTRSAINPRDRPHRLYLMWGCLGLDEAKEGARTWRARAGSDEVRLCPTRGRRLSRLRPVPPCSIRFAPKRRGMGVGISVAKPGRVGHGFQTHEGGATWVGKSGGSFSARFAPRSSSWRARPGDDAREEVDIEVREVGRTATTEGEW